MKYLIGGIYLAVTMSLTILISGIICIWDFSMGRFQRMLPKIGSIFGITKVMDWLQN